MFWALASRGFLMETGFPSTQDLPAVGRVGAGQHPHQGRLAGPVAADETDDFPCIEVDADVADGMDATERDADVAHLDDGRSLRDGHGLVLHARS